MLVISASKGTQEAEIYSSVIESSGFIEIVQIDHQEICMKATGYNQVLVMIDLVTKFAEAAPCMTASAEETCDHLLNVWIARHGCPITFQLVNGRELVGDLTKELMKRSQVAQVHSTNYHPQTNGLVERKNRTTLDEKYQRLIECNFRLEELELAMFTVALLNAMGIEVRGDHPT